MNWLKKGPELKLSGIKTPDFLADLYLDLKERRLLPLVALLVVAIVAVPILLGQAGSTSSEPGEEGAPPVAGASSVNSGALVVAKSAPGLRDYKRRLEHAQAADPFKQHEDEPAEASGEAAPSTGGAASPSSEEPAAPTTGSVPAPGSEGTATGGTTETKYAADSIDVRIVSVPPASEGAKSRAKPQSQVRRNLPELTMLPSRETPAAIFMGTSADGKKALLLVSSDVESIFGDGQCVVGSKTCQLLALEKGLPETFVYGPQGHTYRIEVLKIEKTLSSTPRRAALGSPKKKGKAEPNPNAESPPAAG